MAKEVCAKISVKLTRTHGPTYVLKELKNAMDASASLAMADYTINLHFNVVEKEGVVNAILYQKNLWKKRSPQVS